MNRPAQPPRLLLLLTNDGRLQARVADPRHKMTKVYWVQVEGQVSEEAVDKLKRGVQLKDGPAQAVDAAAIEAPLLWDRQPPIRVRQSIPTSWLRIALREGRNRQVRRMTAAVGLPTLRLVRVAIGPWQLDGLQPGQWRELDLP
ncbi:MAG: Ribosomal large subunit pseudouridine synthase E [Paracidovorax wautersii]|uniref:Ribosomal large subunit pseudouridine synthase E n=1 Tax=Paracidovorax wautersii TaxID=1177982 RepID=A0A7V8JQD4_9BURK|nr:MAG: Ribosomal large subunit pseudouridine synthase E [Paracidovorax wautersii]